MIFKWFTRTQASQSRSLSRSVIATSRIYQHQLSLTMTHCEPRRFTVSSNHRFIQVLQVCQVAPARPGPGCLGHGHRAGQSRLIHSAAGGGGGCAIRGPEGGPEPRRATRGGSPGGPAGADEERRSDGQADRQVRQTTLDRPARPVLPASTIQESGPGINR